MSGIKRITTFEWCWEVTDDYGDIIEHEYCPTLEECISTAPTGADMALVRHLGSEDEGELERGYAYLESSPNGTLTLPERFDNGTKVPARFHSTITKWRLPDTP